MQTFSPGRTGGSVKAQAGMDTPADVRFMSDDIISMLPMPALKKNILKLLALEERRRSTRAMDWLENAIAACDTLLRGFMIGFGASFMYETISSR